MKRYDNDPRMATDLPLLGLPYQKHSETSRAAAHSMRSTSGAKRIEVLHCIADHGPVTDNDICEITGMSGSTVRPRRIELLTAGLIKQAGPVMQGNGRRAETWVTR